MSETHLGVAWQPAAQSERYVSLDLLRGVALFGVLLVNLVGAFRVSLFQHILEFHTHSGWANHVTDALVAGVLEFKALTIFSFLFGVGVAIQVERATPKHISVTLFLIRRFLVLLGLGLCHMLLIWNGDILALYAVCGLLLIPFLRLPAWALLLLGTAFIGLPNFVPLGIRWPSAEAMRANVAEAARVYGHGSVQAILLFRGREAWRSIVPLLIATLPRTVGLMLWGAAAWRSGILREPHRHRRLLLGLFVVGALVGGTLTAVNVYHESSGRPSVIPAEFVDVGGTIPLAFTYAAGILLWLAPVRSRVVASLAAAGQMALTNYLMESIVLGFVFYGYGLGLFGRLGPAAAAWIGIALYIAQLAMSRAWLHRFRFGPVEWLWRSLSYVRRQPFSRPLLSISSPGYNTARESQNIP